MSLHALHKGVDSVKAAWETLKRDWLRGLASSPLFDKTHQAWAVRQKYPALVRSSQQRMVMGKGMETFANLVSDLITNK